VILLISVSWVAGIIDIWPIWVNFCTDVKFRLFLTLSSPMGIQLFQWHLLKRYLCAKPIGHGYVCWWTPAIPALNRKIMSLRPTLGK
jgi:hypothetical protein